MSLRSVRKWSGGWVLTLALVGAGCGSDQVAGGAYGALDGSSGGGKSSASSSGGDDAQASADTGASSSGGGSSSGQSGSSGSEGGSGAEAGTPTSPSCDMNGRWLVAQRVLADAIGQTQTSHNWFYYEITQNADQVTVTKGLHCGYEVVAVSALGASVSSQKSWPAFLTHDSDTGRKGTMEVTSSGCQLAIEKRYTVRGATVAFYSDPNQAMPTMSQKAAGTTPGWEDWDMDGNPGISLTVSEGGSSLGTLYCAQRDWNQFSGSVAANSTKFSVPATWGSDQDALGYAGSSLVTQSSVPDADATQHFVWFAKLDPTQATGDDATICAAIRTLVPTLTPAALN